MTKSDAPSPGSAPRPPAISIVIATRNRGASLRATLESLAECIPPAGVRVELVIVDNGSSDETPDVVREYAQRFSYPVISLDEGTPGKSRALNRALAATCSDWILFTDDDVRFPRNWISSMTQPLRENIAEIVQGGIRWSDELLRLCPDQSYLPRVITSTRHKTDEELSTGPIGANLAISRAALRRIEPPDHHFDVNLGPGALGVGEETLLGWKLMAKGARLVQLLDIEVEHHFDPCRLTPKGILGVAVAKGRSLGYIDVYWRGVRPNALSAKIAWALLKDTLRTALGAGIWPRGNQIPEWKFSYQVTISRLRQIRTELRALQSAEVGQNHVNNKR